MSSSPSPSPLTTCDVLSFLSRLQLARDEIYLIFSLTNKDVDRFLMRIDETGVPISKYNQAAVFSKIRVEPDGSVLRFADETHGGVGAVRRSCLRLQSENGKLMRNQNSSDKSAAEAPGSGGAAGNGSSSSTRG